jgi:hypothetical protein
MLNFLGAKPDENLMRQDFRSTKLVCCDCKDELLLQNCGGWKVHEGGFSGKRVKGYGET